MLPCKGGGITGHCVPPTVILSGSGSTPTPARIARFVEAVWCQCPASCLVVAPDDDCGPRVKTPALDRRCIEGEVEKNYARNFGLSPPLHRRPPLDKLGR